MKTILVLISVLSIFLFFQPLAAREKVAIPEYTVEGLKLIPDTKDVALVWADPDADLSQYKRITLLEPYIAFKKNWQRDQNRSSTTRVRTSDMDRIKGRTKTLFMEVFTEELEQGGYSLTSERAHDVLIVRPAIIDLNVSAPDVRSSGRVETYTQSAGSMTLYLELYDAETNDLLAKVLDPKADRQSGFMQWQTGPANLAAGKRMMKPWAQALRSGLDEARDATHR